MKRIVLLFFVLVLLLSGNIRGWIAEKHLPPFSIEKDIYDFNLAMESFVIDPEYTDYKLQVDLSYLPENKGLPNVPVIYLTDGQWRRIDHKYIHYLTYKKIIPPVLVVGVGYPPEVPADLARIYDLLYDPQSFLREMTEEIIPLVEERYNVDQNRRILFGASAGGHFVVYAFLQNALAARETFSGYIGSSPHLLHTQVFTVAEELISREREINAGLYLAYGQKESSYVYGSPNQRLFAILDRGNLGKLRFWRHAYPGADHYSTTRLTLVDGLRLLLGGADQMSAPRKTGAIDLSYQTFFYDFCTSTQFYDWNTNFGVECSYSTDPRYSVDGQPGSVKVSADFGQCEELVFQTSSVYFEGFADKEIKFSVYIPPDLAGLGYELCFLLHSTIDMDWITDQSEGFPIEQSGWNTFQYKWRGKPVSGNIDCVRGFGVIITRKNESPVWSGDLYFDDIHW
ncbi:MAG TPA: alpha/beta hydrolase-fold protein [Bacillota bacterium]